MEEVNLLEEGIWQPFARFGLTHPFFSLNSDTLINTWIILLGLAILLIFLRRMIHKHGSIGQCLSIMFVDYFYKLCEQGLGIRSFNHFSFITALFTFILACNAAPVFPWLEEPTKDLNTTLAFGLVTFLYNQFYGIKMHGLIGYLKEYLAPFFIMLPLNIIGRVATVVSISFRLFGNIFGGAIISSIYFNSIRGSILLEIVGIGPGLVITAFFGLFEGFLQAFVFSMLALTYLSIALYGEAGEASAEEYA
ncbi:F0F1 ATP synthase subunit A [Candidatus Dependentiae bacterium]|nr:F0F1 ATP synthase subunit A [Candidatus Dependentiae bacterium]